MSTRIGFERNLLIVGILRLACSLEDGEDELFMKAVRHLEVDGFYPDQLDGMRLDSHGKRGAWADHAVLRAVIGESLPEIVKVLQKAGRDDLAEKLSRGAA